MQMYGSEIRTKNKSFNGTRSSVWWIGGGGVEISMERVATPSRRLNGCDLHGNVYQSMVIVCLEH